MSPNSIEAALEMRSVVNQMKPPPSPSPNYTQFNSENARFAEPTEAEYLRNVLYRYMVERETLGKEIVVCLFLLIPLKLINNFIDTCKSYLSSTKIFTY